jgi:hypothetical protein
MDALPGGLARAAADAVLVLHAAFVAFVVAGGLAVARVPRLAWLHLPAAAWGAAISFGGWICPLTPLENALRRAAGEAGYAGGFVERYLLAALYPEGLTRGVQVALGVGVVAINVAAYAHAWARRRRRSERRAAGAPVR